MISSSFVYCMQMNYRPHIEQNLYSVDNLTVIRWLILPTMVAKDSHSEAVISLKTILFTDECLQIDSN